MNATLGRHHTAQHSYPFFPSSEQFLRRNGPQLIARISASGLEVRFWREAARRLDDGFQERLVFVVPVYRVIASVKPVIS